MLGCQVCLHLSQLVGGNETDDLAGILGQLLESDGELLGAQGATLEKLLSEAAEDVRIGAVEADTVVFLGDLAVLLVGRLALVELHDGLGSPSGIGTELLFDVSDNRFVHRGNSVVDGSQNTRTK